MILQKILYLFEDKVYLNITNRCPCRCEFCIRDNLEGVGSAERLWLDREPTLDEIKQAIDAFDFGGRREVVFCGFGEPTNAFDNLIGACKYIKEKYGFRIRVNTNGLSDLINGRPTAKELCQAVDAVSISLNSYNREKYHEIVRSRFGEEAFDAMLAFAKECKSCLKDVKLTVVDVIPPEDIDQCRRVAGELGIPLRVRVYTP